MDAGDGVDVPMVFRRQCPLLFCGRTVEADKVVDVLVVMVRPMPTNWKVLGKEVEVLQERFIDKVVDVPVMFSMIR